MAKSRKSFTTVSRGGTRISNDQPGRRSLLFNQVNSPAKDKNVFDLSHGVTMSGKMGNLMPLNVIKCVPGDIHKVGNESFIRLAPMIAPPMQQINCSIHNWFIPARLLWPGFEDFTIGAANNPMPYIIIDFDELNTDMIKFLDYMGIPPIQSGGTPTQVNALPFAAYYYLWFEKYRDQNFIATGQDFVPLVDGDNSAQYNKWLAMRKVAWEHDLFTSALPQASFGADVSIPLGSVVLDPIWDDATSKPRFRPEGLADVSGDIEQAGTTPPTITVGGLGINAYDPDGTLNVEATTIKELRQALKKQEFLELLARGGKRYYEVMERLWNIDTSDSRFQQPEWISGTKTPVIISEVLNTTGTEDLPQGNMAGHGISLGYDNGKNFFCEEYGYIISVMFITPKSGYHQGIPKHYLEMDHYDYGNWIQFEHIGEQELTNQEIYAYTAGKEDTFGYVPRYAHLKFMPDRIAGDMRDPAKLEHWTMNRTFATAPSLNQTFIEVNPDDPSITRVFAVEDGSDYLYIDIWNKIRSVRPFSVFGNPNL